MIKSKVENDIFDTIKQAVKLVFEEMEVTTKRDLKYLPTKEDYYAAQDQMMGELKAIREEQTIISKHHSDYSDRIEALEKIHPNHSHAKIATLDI